MRKITQNAVNAFKSGRQFSQANMLVDAESAGVVRMYLHGNLIAEKRDNEPLVITLAGWPTATTRERLTGLLQSYGTHYVAQRSGKQVLGCTHLGELGEREIDPNEFVEIAV